MLKDMEFKFFDHDVIGRKPKKVGDRFAAMFMGVKGYFIVTQFSHGCIFAKLVV